MDGIGGKTPTYNFGNISYLSLNAGVRVRGGRCLSPGTKVPKSIPLEEGVSRHKSTDLRGSRDDKELPALTQHCPGGPKASCSDTLALCQWVRPVTDPALLSC